jgi:carbonic anhydrase/acetyltransferase-like protein (isoleucine patch superfamily)
VGEHTVFYGPNLWAVDIQRPWLIEIGDYCKITRGVQILTHDYSRSVLRRGYGDIIAEAKKTKIGNNVFVGTNSVILMGTIIGDNVIIGAGSVVSGNIPANSVVAGNPARVIRTLEEHLEVRKRKYITEAKECAKEFYNKYGKKPDIHDMGAFFPLYAERNIRYLKENKLRTKLGGDDEQDVIEKYLCSSPAYKDFEEFLKDIDW